MNKKFAPQNCSSYIAISPPSSHLSFQLFTSKMTQKSQLRNIHLIFKQFFFAYQLKIKCNLPGIKNLGGEFAYSYPRWEGATLPPPPSTQNLQKRSVSAKTLQVCRTTLELLVSTKKVGQTSIFFTDLNTFSICGEYFHPKTVLLQENWHII